MNILITGGAGFLGSHLCRRFLKDGHSVVCLDNFITGSRENIAGILDKPRFSLIEHDISQPICFAEKLDWVLHFASIASPVHYMKYPIKTLKSGLNGTHNCLGIAKAHKAKFFLASTSEIYGDPLVHPQQETYWGNVNSIGLRSCYDESKRAAEALTYAYMRSHNLDVRVIRIFNTYGPNMQFNDGRVVSSFIVQALRGNDLTIFGDGTHTRSFCYVDDLVEGALNLMSKDYQQPVNLGNPAEYKVLDLASIIIELTKSKSKIKFELLPQDDPKRRQPDITVAKKVLGWQPKVSLREGLEKSVKWFAERLKIENECAK
ncbi:MAG: SDR family oxidoreductase [Candidatus Omnitrophica bacterium]|nr:SDR family oxidoreductase [Candidatus Omnitrophota bacterium]